MGNKSKAKRCIPPFEPQKVKQSLIKLTGNNQRFKTKWKNVQAMSWNRLETGTEWILMAWDEY